MSEELIKRLRFMGDPANGSVDHRTIREAADALARPAPAVQMAEGELTWRKRLLEEFTHRAQALCDKQGGHNVTWPEFVSMFAELVRLPELAPAPATVATEAVAQECFTHAAGQVVPKAMYDQLMSNYIALSGKAVDAEKIMALVQEFGEQCEAAGYLDRSGSQDASKKLHEAAYQTAVKIRALLSASPAGVGGLEPVEGDLLPPVGSKVLIHLASPDAWVEHTVAGYYVWGDLGGSKHLHRVFVRVVSESGYPNARMLHEVRPLPAAPAIANQEPQDGR